MADFFDCYGRTEIEELARIHDSGAEGLRKREIAPQFFDKLLEHDLIKPYGPEHFAVSRRGMIKLERAHMLNA